MQRRPLIAAALAVLLTALSADAKVHTVFIRNTGRDATPEFKFRVLPSPAESDAATGATFTLVVGEQDPNGADLAALHDGRTPRGEDSPGENFFFNAGTEGGRVVVDLGGLTVVEQISTYSWHTGSRGPQVYRLYASVGDAEEFDAQPAAGTDPATCGWKLVADVDTRPEDRTDEGGGQYAASIFDSAGPLGRYRYLLFDISRTEATTPFGNTFYSEIDILGTAAADIAVADANEGIHSFETAGGGYQFTIDTSETPDLTEWATKELAPVVQAWYPKIVEMLPSDDYEAPKSFSITFSPQMRGVAAAGGTRIRGGSEWFGRNLEGEAKGAIVHELVHVVQQYGRARRTGGNRSRPPGWLVEGIPDYIRWFLYEPETRGAEITQRNIDRARYDASYRISGNFLNWVTQQHGETVIPKLNAALREGRYNEDIWQELTGNTLEDLAAKWKVNLERAIAAGAGEAPADEDAEANE
jgi:hypothetical protein